MRLSQAELKHGRVCMLAFVGFLAVDLGNTWPSAPHVSSLMAHDAAVKNGNMLFLLGVIGILEVPTPPHTAHGTTGRAVRGAPEPSLLRRTTSTTTPPTCICLGGLRPPLEARQC